MTRESFQWLQDSVRVGFNQEKNRVAWWAPEGSERAEGVYYPGALPFEEARRLINFPVEEITLGGTDSQGRGVDPDRKAYYRPDTRDVLTRT